ncbi:MAG: ABC transporter permease [Anaerolineales bacterium]|nr:MAG: ABC transporter permease [Anaerolineales bacterium]
MRTVGIVAKHEIITTFKKRSFWLFTVLMPALLLALNAYSVIQDNGLGNARSDAETAAAEEADTTTDTPMIGLVDDAKLISKTPADIPPDRFVPFPDEATARAALEAEEIDQYVRIPADYLTTGEITAYDRNFQILRSGENMGVAFDNANEWMLTYLINYNLTGDQQLASALRNPIPCALAERHLVSPPPETYAGDQALAEIVASAMPYIYYFILIVVSGYTLQSVTAEKENRTVEVLLLSLPPRELMAGKILGLSGVALVQVAVWLGGGILILNRGANLLNVYDFTFPPGFLAWATLFLVLGYLLYASVMAATGAIAPNAREGRQVTWLLILPLLPTLMFGRLFLEEPHGTISLVLSLFPFSAPSAMVTRLAVAQVPAWQLGISLLGLSITTYLFVALAARLFSANNLLSHAPFSWRRVATEWRQSAS